MTAGHIRAPLEVTLQTVKAYDKYKEILPYVEEVKYDPQTKQVFIHGSLMRYHVIMTTSVVEEKTPTGYKISYTGIAGHFLGIKADMVLDRVGDSTTEISLHARYVADRIPIPSFILNWGLEVAGKKMASKMRSHIEETWINSQK